MQKAVQDGVGAKGHSGRLLAIIMPRRWFASDAAKKRLGQCPAPRGHAASTKPEGEVVNLLEGFET